MRHALKLSVMIVVCLSLTQQMPAPTRNVRVNYKETMLKNGLRVITVEDHTAPVVSTDRKSTRLNSSHIQKSRMPSSA